MKRYFFIILSLILFFTLTACSSESEKISQALIPIEINQQDFEDLNKINDLIFEKSDFWKDVATHYYHLYPEDLNDDTFYSLSERSFDEHLVDRNSPQYDFLNRHYGEYSKWHDKLYIHKIDFRPSDKLIQYEINYTMIGDSVIYHTLMNNESLLKEFNPEKIYSVKKLDNGWVYVIWGYEYMGR